MKCTCGSDMKHLSKFVARLYKPYEEVANGSSVVALTTMTQSGTLLKRTQSMSAVLEPYMCPDCGAIQYKVADKDKKWILQAEDDATYKREV